MLTTKQYAELYGVSQRTVQRWIQNGTIFAVRIGRSFQIPEDETPIANSEPELSTAQEEAEPKSNYYTPRQFADANGVDFQDVVRWMITGYLPFERIGGEDLILKTTAPPQNEFQPEQYDDTDDQTIEVTDESQFNPADLRQEFPEYSDAEDYAAPIPVPFIIIKNSTGLYRVIIQYDVVDEAEFDAEDEEQPES